jgi:hypothetical protein
MAGAESDVEILIEPRSLDYDASDPRWLDTVDELRNDVKVALRGEDGEIVEREQDAAGHKGGIVELVLALGSSGAISAAVMVCKAWLESGRNREIVITRREGDKETKISVQAVGVSEAHLLEQMRTALAKPATSP